jgi:Cellulase (glycosyl hydrolase family 5)
VIKFRPRLLASIIGLVGVLGTVGAGCESPQPSSPAGTPSTTEPPTTATYSVDGPTILRDGVPYLPYGITVFGLARPTWESLVSADLAQIRATAAFWHGNTVRIQVAPPIYLDEPASRAALDEEVGTAVAHGLNVILSAQYQSVHPLAGPDASTLTFWRSIAPTFRGLPQVWFDLFNEPELSSWALWRNGGEGVVGMQTLVNAIRAEAPHNLIVAEGLDQAETLQGVSGYLLSGSGIVYSVHPYLIPGRDTPASWNADWGALSAYAPVLVGEWGQYDERKPECRTDAPVLVPQFLEYLQRHKIGLIAWALVPGVLIRGQNLNDPTSFDPGVPYTCRGGLDTGPDAQGAGRDLVNLFQTGTGTSVTG